MPGDFLEDVREGAAEGLCLLSLPFLPFSSALQLHFPQPRFPWFPLSGPQNTLPRPQFPLGQVSLLSHHLPTQLLCASGESEGESG